jgi:MoaA/NifB/PqqE/SkfB family radical SAM enzyme
MTLSQVDALCGKIHSLGPLVVSIGGGEPTMHPELVDITGKIAQNNFPVMICNGWHVTKDLARALFTQGMREVSISVDYADAKKHDAQRGKTGAFDKALSALSALHQSRTRADQRVHMISVVMDDNIDEIEKLAKISREIGITYLITFYSNSRGTKESKISRSDISRRLLDVRKRYPEFVVIREFIERYAEAQCGSGIAPCYAGVNLFNVDCTGSVSRCIDRLDESAGNIFTDELYPIMEKLRTMTVKSRCGACWTSCRGNIETMIYGKYRLRNLVEYRNIVKKIPLCVR